MKPSAAFGISEEDITHVLRQNAVHVANTNGVSFAALGEQIFATWTDKEFDRVAMAALVGGVELDDQTMTAYGEIRTILVEQGVLER